MHLNSRKPLTVCRAIAGEIDVVCDHIFLMWVWGTGRKHCIRSEIKEGERKVLQGREPKTVLLDAQCEEKGQFLEFKKKTQTI